MHMPGEDDISPSPPKSTEDMLSQEEHNYQQPKRGEIRIGQVVLVGPNEIVVDVGAKREGVVGPQDMERLSAQDRTAISVGDKISVYVVNPEDRDGNTIVSIYLAQIEQDWLRAEAYLEGKKIIEATVIGYNKGGLVVPFGKIRGFVPASQVVGLPRQLSPNQRLEHLSQQVGREILVQIIEVDRRRRRLIMSEQVAQSESHEQQLRKLVDSLVEGQVVHGVVTSLANFGAFVDLGGIDGLIHISELSWRRVKHPREVLQVGDEVDVCIRSLDRDRNRIALSLRRPETDPLAKYVIGQRVEGTITRVIDSGAFAYLEDGIEGVIHISELSDAEISHPSEVVKRGEKYVFSVIKVEPKRQRIGLSLKRVSPDEQVIWRTAQASSASFVADPQTGKPQPEPVIGKEPIKAYAIAGIKDHSEDQPLQVSSTYVLEAGISRSLSEGFEIAPIILPKERKGTRLEIVVYAEDMDISPSWVKSYTFEQDRDNVIKFRLTPRAIGRKVIRVEFLYQHHWLAQIKFEVEVVEAPELIPV